MDIFFFRDEQQHGPYTIEEVQNRLKAGSVGLDTPAWHEGLEDWSTVGRLLPQYSTPPSGYHPPLPPPRSPLATQGADTAARTHHSVASKANPTAPQQTVDASKPISKTGMAAGWTGLGAIVLAQLVMRNTNGPLMQEFKNDLMMGLMWGAFFGLIPFFIGKSRRNKRGNVGFLSCLGAGAIMGILALPVAIVFSIFILKEPASGANSTSSDTGVSTPQS